jgi:hypothetical protein
MSVLDDAQALAGAGLSLIPIRRDGSKAPALPAGHDVLMRRRRAAADELAAWFGGPAPAGIGIQCGAASGGLVVLDFEDRRAFDRWAVRVNDTAPGCLDSLPMVETPGGRPTRLLPGRGPGAGREQAGVPADGRRAGAGGRDSRGRALRRCAGLAGRRASGGRGIQVHPKGVAVVIGRLLCWLGRHKPDPDRMGTMCFGYLDWRPTRFCLRCGTEWQTWR